MTNSPVILGDPDSILRLPKAGLLNRSEWEQMDSDVLAHFLQVTSQIMSSRWYSSKVSFQDGGECTFPAFEEFVYAAVYFRQLIAKGDALLNDAVTRYTRFVDCQARAAWVKHELQSFEASLKGTAFFLPQFTPHELFEAFIYGAGLFHKIPKVNDEKRERFLEIYDKNSKGRVLFALNGSMQTLLNHVGHVARVIRRDYSNWLIDYSLPAPDTRWHDRLFDFS